MVACCLHSTSSRNIVIIVDGCISSSSHFTIVDGCMLSSFHIITQHRHHCGRLYIVFIPLHHCGWLHVVFTPHHHATSSSLWTAVYRLHPTSPLWMVACCLHSTSSCHSVLIVDHVRQASQPFFTVDPQVFRYGAPSSDDFIEIFLRVCLFFAFLFVKKMSAIIYSFYVNSSHVTYIYLCPHYMYVTKHFSVGPMYSRYGPHQETLM